MLSLAGKVALVTGAGRGMGAAIAEKLAEYGATVAVTDFDLASAKDVAARISRSGKAKEYRYDVTDTDAGKQLVEHVEQQLGGIDILVNNAGVSRLVRFIDLDLAEWDRLMNINLRGVFLTCRAVLPGMVERGYGRVINMGSVLSKVGEANLAHYAASKFAVLGLTQSIAAEVAQFGITANTVCPGIVDTPLSDGLISDAGGNPDELREMLRSRIPLGRMQTPEDVAEMVSFLASDLARNITGSSFHVDGGLQPR